MGYSPFDGWLDGRRWHILVLPRNLDQACLIKLVATVHKANPEDRYEFFDADSKDLRKYVTYNGFPFFNEYILNFSYDPVKITRAREAGHYSEKWIRDHQVAVLATEEDPQHCPIWILKGKQGVITSFEKLKCTPKPSNGAQR
jgi:hypothetical protein